MQQTFYPRKRGEIGLPEEKNAGHNNLHNVEVASLIHYTAKQNTVEGVQLLAQSQWKIQYIVLSQRNLLKKAKKAIKNPMLTLKFEPD